MQLTTFLFTVIHEDSTSENTQRIVAFVSLALQSDKKLFQKGNLENKAWYLLCLKLTFTHKALVSIPTCIGYFTDFLPDISSDNET